MKKFWPALFWALIILVLSTMPSVQLPETPLLSPDKIGHALVYGILVVLLLRGLSQTDIYTKKNIVFVILGSAAYGFLMEIIQYSFFPNRYFEMADNYANITGCFLGLLIFDKIVKHRF